MDSNGWLSEEEREYVFSIYVSDLGIQSLEGIACFTNLETLDCSFNQIDRLDVSHNLALTHLECQFNQLTVLDLSHNPSLTLLNCDQNALASLDISGNPELGFLSCDRNRLTCLDVSNNTLLDSFWCSDNVRTLVIDGNSVDLTAFPGFDPSKTSEWEGGRRSGNRLIVNETGDVTYTYDCGGGHTATFTLDVILSATGLLVLPEGLKVIETEAFMGGHFSSVIVPAGCERIDSRAFANCGNLRYIRLPYDLDSIADDAFEGCSEDLEIAYH